MSEPYPIKSWLKKYKTMPLDLTPSTPPYYTIDQTLPNPPDTTIAAIYRATLTQAGTADPIATEDTNNSLTGITWTRSAAGNYLGTKTGAFILNKTFITTTPQGTGLVGQVQAFRSSADTINVQTYTVGTSTNADDILTTWNIEITITN